MGSKSRGSDCRRAAAAVTGEIVAIRRPGGFHLACDARNPEAVERIRALKGRGAKPQAVMVANRAASATLGAAVRSKSLRSTVPSEPIVVCEKRPVDYELWGCA